MSDTTVRQHAPDPARTRPRREPDPAVVHLRVVKPQGPSPARRRRRVRFFGVTISVFVVAVVFALVGVHVMLAQNQFRLDRLNAKAAAEQADYERSRLQVDQLSAPSRIVGTAESRLGMIPATSVKALMPSPLPAKTTTATTAAGRAAQSPTSSWNTVKPHLVPSQ
jgi:cell division protein FtsL